MWDTKANINRGLDLIITNMKELKQLSVAQETSECAHMIKGTLENCKVISDNVYDLPEKKELNCILMMNY
jgi:hypothetical protein